MADLAEVTGSSDGTETGTTSSTETEVTTTSTRGLTQDGSPYDTQEVDTVSDPDNQDAEVSHNPTSTTGSEMDSSLSEQWQPSEGGHTDAPDTGSPTVDPDGPGPSVDDPSVSSGGEATSNPTAQEAAKGAAEVADSWGENWSGLATLVGAVGSVLAIGYTVLRGG